MVAQFAWGESKAISTRSRNTPEASWNVFKNKINKKLAGAVQAVKRINQLLIS